MNPRKPLGVLALVAVAGALAFPLMPSSDAAVAESPEKTQKSVVVSQATASETAHELRFSGVVRAKRAAKLSFTGPGRVQKRWVEVGDRVEAGAVIAALDRRGASNRIARAKAGIRQAREQLAQGKRDHTRADQLAADRAASQAELESAAHAVSMYSVSRDAAQVELDEANRVHRDGIIRSPFTGTVVRVNAEPGEFVGAGQSVVQINGDALEVEVQVPETVLADIGVGDTAQLTLPLQKGERITGRIESIGHGGEGAGRLFPVVVALPSDADLIPGMTADFVLSRQGQSGVTVPVSSVVDAGGGQTTVFVIDDAGLAQRRSVEVSQLLGVDALVTQGLTAGEQVVSAGHFGLVPGQTVQVQR
ncbi:MAG: efflux RND transporter periplasmic adaptor subunit [Nannocystales bacterium]